MSNSYTQFPGKTAIIFKTLTQNNSTFREIPKLDGVSVEVVE